MEASKNYADRLRKNTPVTEVAVVAERYIILHENGRCDIFDPCMRAIFNGSVVSKVDFVNSSEDEVIRSIFHNKSNDSLIVVALNKKDEFSTLKTRSIRLR